MIRHPRGESSQDIRNLLFPRFIVFKSSTTMIAEIQKSLSLEDHLELRIAKLEAEISEYLQENKRLVEENNSLRRAIAK